MSAINRIRLVSKGDCLTYSTLSLGKYSITVEQLAEKFREVETVRVTNSDNPIYYFENVQSPDLLMRISISGGEITMLLATKAYFKSELAIT